MFKLTQISERICLVWHIVNDYDTPRPLHTLTVLTQLVLPDFSHAHAWHVQWTGTLFSRHSLPGVSSSNYAQQFQSQICEQCRKQWQKELALTYAHTSVFTQPDKTLESWTRTCHKLSCTSKRWRHVDHGGSWQTAPVDVPNEHCKRCVNFTPDQFWIRKVTVFHYVNNL